MIKKIKIKNIVLLLSLLMMTGCGFMDCDESDNFTKQEVLDSYNRVKQLATNVYGFLKADFCSIDGAMLDAATDDAVHIYKSSNIQRFVDGTWSANNLVDNVWGHYYEGIRAANFYLKETAGLTFDEWKYSDDYEAIMKEFTNYQYEVRFLRAYFYFELIKRYRNIPFGREIYIEQEDFMEEAPKKFFRLKPGGEVRLKHAYIIKCEDVIKDDSGNVIELRCSYDPDTKSGGANSGRKVKGTLHWVSAKHAIKAEVRLYENLIDEEKGVYNKEDGSLNLNPNSLQILKECYVEDSFNEAGPCDSFQFVRNGYFCIDTKDSTDDHFVFNRIVSLKSSFKLPKK